MKYTWGGVRITLMSRAIISGAVQQDQQRRRAGASGHKLALDGVVERCGHGRGIVRCRIAVQHVRGDGALLKEERERRLADLVGNCLVGS